MVRFVSAVLLALVCGAVGSVAVAQTRSVSWLRYDVDLNVQPDGSVQVSETQTIAFQGTYQQGFRIIPTDRVTGIDSVSVAEVVNGRNVAYQSNPAQAPNTFRTSSSSDGLRIDWSFPPTTDAPRTFVLAYTIRGAIRVYDAGDQLEWKAIYADRQGPIAASSVTVRFPSDVASDALKTSFSRYTVDQQSRIGALPSAGAGQQIDARTVRFDTGSLAAGTGAEVRLQYPHGLVAASQPPWQADADRADAIQQSLAPLVGFVALLLTFVIAAGGGSALFLLWYLRGRDPAAGVAPPVLDRPPSDLPAPLAGTLIDGVADVQDAVATLVDLAQRGVLVMADEDNPGLAGNSHDVRLTLAQSLSSNAAGGDGHGIRAYERLLLESLFGANADANASVRLSDIRARFSATIPSLQAELHRGVAAAGLFVENPESVRQRYHRLAWTLVVIGVILAIGGVVALGWAVGIAWLPGLALVVVGLVLWRLALVMPRRTPAGAVEAARWRAFKAHLLHPNLPAETTRPEDLPYAVAFGVDHAFLRRLESVGWQAPTWYPRGPGVVILPGGGYGYGPGWGWPTPGPGGDAGAAGPGGGLGGGIAGGLGAGANPQGWSDVLAGLLNAASEAMASGGGSGGWSGGGFGGGGGGGGGSGGFN